jgi:hypothetical protein
MSRGWGGAWGYRPWPRDTTPATLGREPWISLGPLAPWPRRRRPLNAEPRGREEGVPDPAVAETGQDTSPPAHLPRRGGRLDVASGSLPPQRRGAPRRCGSHRAAGRTHLRKSPARRRSTPYAPPSVPAGFPRDRRASPCQEGQRLVRSRGSEPCPQMSASRRLREPAGRWTPPVALILDREVSMGSVGRAFLDLYALTGAIAGRTREREGVIRLVVGADGPGAERAPYGRVLEREPQVAEALHGVQSEAARCGGGAGEVGVALTHRNLTDGPVTRTVRRDQVVVHRPIVPRPPSPDRDSKSRARATSPREGPTQGDRSPAAATGARLGHW